MNLLPKELADRLRVSVGTLANWRVKGYGPTFIKCGKKILYPVAKVEAWEEENMRANTAAAAKGKKPQHKGFNWSYFDA